MLYKWSVAAFMEYQALQVCEWDLCSLRATYAFAAALKADFLYKDSH